MGRHPVAVVNLHITYARTMKVDYSRFSLGGLHGKHVVICDIDHYAVCHNIQFLSFSASHDTGHHISMFISDSLMMAL
jgi:hypothetical protein